MNGTGKEKKPLVLQAIKACYYLVQKKAARVAHIHISKITKDQINTGIDSRRGGWLAAYM